MRAPDADAPRAKMRRVLNRRMRRVTSHVAALAVSCWASTSPARNGRSLLPTGESRSAVCRSIGKKEPGQENREKLEKSGKARARWGRRGEREKACWPQPKR